jgi:hypothetical protein
MNITYEVRYEDDFEPPKYSDPGRILVHILGPSSTRVYRYESEVLDHDGSTFWISEGVGFDYWLSACLDVNEQLEGYYVIEGVIGRYIKGDGYSTDDDEEWEFDLCRRATDEEIATACLA